jgi:hypothetical protein
MRKARIYVDTSVIGGCCDPEFQEWSEGLLSDFQKENFLLVLSELAEAKIQEAPKEVREVHVQFRKCVHEFVLLTDEAIEWADAYLRRKILPLNYRDDARHIAMATISGADLLINWNFRHIVHFKNIQKFNAVNIELGYKPIQIYSPREVTSYGRESS